MVVIRDVHLFHTVEYSQESKKKKKMNAKENSIHYYRNEMNGDRQIFHQF